MKKPIKRSLKDKIIEDLGKKMVFVAGPRQCGKTTLALEIIKNDSSRYLNWDAIEDRENILKNNLPLGSGFLVLDEIHKYAKWRNFIKGLFDKRKEQLKILVTGSAKLNYYRYGGDSLQGRYHLLRMHPLTFKEVGENDQKTLKKLLELGVFPEPFFSDSVESARRWSREYRSRLINEDLVQLERVSEISLVERLATRLPDLVGSSLSINSLREDLEVSHVTVTRWLNILENMYHIYRLLPFGSAKIKAVKKESKHYHFDWSVVENPGARFENLIANHLLKYCNYIEDSEGFDMELRFYRDREQREVDFVIIKNRKPIEFIECKLSAVTSTPPSMAYLKNKFPEVMASVVSLEETKGHVDKLGIRYLDAKTYLWDKI